MVSKMYLMTIFRTFHETQSLYNTEYEKISHETKGAHKIFRDTMKYLAYNYFLILEIGDV